MIYLKVGDKVKIPRPNAVFGIREKDKEKISPNKIYTVASLYKGSSTRIILKDLNITFEGSREQLWFSVDELQPTNEKEPVTNWKSEMKK